MELKLNNKSRAVIISFVAGFLQALTFVLVYILYKLAPTISTMLSLVLIAIIIINEFLSYIMLKMSMILIKNT